MEGRIVLLLLAISTVPIRASDTHQEVSPAEIIASSIVEMAQIVALARIECAKITAKGKIEASERCGLETVEMLAPLAWAVVILAGIASISSIIMQ